MRWDPGGGEIWKEGDIQHEVGSGKRVIFSMRWDSGGCTILD
jgi:hypothetical protein